MIHLSVYKLNRPQKEPLTSQKCSFNSHGRPISLDKISFIVPQGNIIKPFQSLRLFWCQHPVAQSICVLDARLRAFLLQSMRDKPLVFLAGRQCCGRRRGGGDILTEGTEKASRQHDAFKGYFYIQLFFNRFCISSVSYDNIVLTKLIDEICECIEIAKRSQTGKKHKQPDYSTSFKQKIVTQTLLASITVYRQALRFSFDLPHLQQLCIHTVNVALLPIFRVCLLLALPPNKVVQTIWLNFQFVYDLSDHLDCLY